MARDTSPPPQQSPTLPRHVLQRVRSGDPEALGKLFDTFFDRLYRLAFHLCGDREMAEDITQDTFVKIHRGAGTLDPDRDCWPWMMSIAYNVYRDFLRAAGHKMRSRSVSLQDADVEKGVTTAERNPEESALREERREIVQGALSQLPEEQRQVVVLHNHAGLTHREIADLVGANAASTRKVYSRAMARLARTLEESLG